MQQKEIKKINLNQIISVFNRFTKFFNYVYRSDYRSINSTILLIFPRSFRIFEKAAEQYRLFIKRLYSRESKKRAKSAQSCDTCCNACNVFSVLTYRH